MTASLRLSESASAQDRPAARSRARGGGASGRAPATSGPSRRSKADGRRGKHGSPFDDNGSLLRRRGQLARGLVAGGEGQGPRRLRPRLRRPAHLAQQARHLRRARRRRPRTRAPCAARSAPSRRRRARDAGAPAAGGSSGCRDRGSPARVASAQRAGGVARVEQALGLQVAARRRPRRRCGSRRASSKGRSLRMDPLEPPRQVGHAQRLVGGGQGQRPPAIPGPPPARVPRVAGPRPGPRACACPAGRPA